MEGFISEIEGLKSEELTSKLIQLMLEQQGAYGPRIIDFLTKQLDSTSPKPQLYKSCSVEEHLDVTDTSEGQDGTLARGRIDILIRFNDFIIGIENKLYAGFTERQPEKYAQPLRKKALEYFDDGERFALFLLMPKFREGDEQVRIKLDVDRCVFSVIYWEDLLDAIKLPETTDLDPIEQTIYSYLESRFNFVEDYESRYEELNSSLDRVDALPIKKQLLYSIWYLINPTPSGRLSQSSKDGKMEYLGYYFYRSETEPCASCWFGFVPTANLGLEPMTEAPGTSTLVIHIPVNPPALEIAELEIVTTGDRDWMQKGSLWKIKFDRHWSRIQDWAVVFNKINTALKSRTE